MDQKSKNRYEAQAAVIKALAHPSRLMMLEELNNGKKNVTELTKMVGADTSTVSKHLNVLKNEGLVFVEKEGTTVFYQLRMPCLMDFISCIESVMEANAFEHMETVISCKTKTK